MKFRIFGTLFVLAVLAAVFVLTQDPSAGNSATNQPVAPPADIVFQPLKIN